MKLETRGDAMHARRISLAARRRSASASPFMWIRTLTMAMVTMLVTGCPGRKDVECGEDTDCDLSTGGVCTLAGTGRRWCAYPDPACESGFRFSTVDVGDGVGGTCTDGAGRQMLTVSLTGGGAGTVTSNPGGLTCTATSCTGAFPVGTVVQLTALPSQGAFLGWSDACTGRDTCAVTMDRARTVGALFGTPGDSLWAVQFGGGEGDVGQGLAIDSAGDIIAVGFFTATVEFGTTTLTSAGSSDIYVVKLAAATGSVLWAKQFGGVNGEAANRVALDASDNIYVFGSISGPVDFGAGPVPYSGFSDCLLLKLSSSGAFEWARTFGGVGVDNAFDVAARGDVVAVTGGFRNTMTIDTTTLTSAGLSDAYVAVFGFDGTARWAKGMGAGSLDLGLAVAIDASGDVIVGGRFTNTVDFGGGPLTSAGNFDAFLARYAGATGAHLFSRRFGSTGADQVAVVRVDSNNQIYIVGAFTGTVDFGGATPLTATTSSLNATDIFVAKYSLAGAHLWSRAFGGSDDELANAATVNASGDIAIVGSFCGTISFGGPSISSASTCPSDDVFAARLSGADGSHIASARVGGAANEEGHGVAESADGRFYVTGQFEGFADFGREAFTSRGGLDAFVLGLAPL
ncbi:MAG: hypothetical protein KIT31_17260 [Deltaproteobacteria bacterium]|nr:hypothetical protein [Deltaproteobacteria bacterium]